MTSERTLFNNLYDADTTWKVTKAGKTEAVNNCGMSLGGFSQPLPFIKVLEPLAKTEDGFIDRFLICSIKPSSLSEDDIDRYAQLSDKSLLKNFSSKIIDIEKNLLFIFPFCFFHYD